MNSSASPGLHRRAAQAEQLREHLLHRLGVVGVDLQPQIGAVAVGAADAELLHLETAVELDHGVEDLLHDVGVDQVALGLHALLERKRLAVRGHGLGLGFQIADFQLIGYLLLERKLDFEAGKAQEVAVVGAERGAVFDGKGGEVSVHDQRASGLRFREQFAQNAPVSLCGSRPGQRFEELSSPSPRGCLFGCSWDQIPYRREVAMRRKPRT